MTPQLRTFALLAVLASSSAFAANEEVGFAKHIAPIFSQHCIRCHADLNSKGDFSLTTIADLKANDYVTAGDAEASHLIELVTSTDGAPALMP